MDLLQISITLCWYIIFNTKTHAESNTSTLLMDHVDPYGNVRPVLFNPAYRNWANEKPTGHVNPAIDEGGKRGRIIGGRSTQISEVPYQIYFYLRSLKGVWCGGSIHNRKTILTAAHCFYNGNTPRRTSEMVVVAGQEDVNLRLGFTMQRLVTEFIVHPEYKSNVVGMYDIGIAKLRTPLRYTAQVQPIQIGYPPENTEAVVSGWGFTITRESKEPTPSHGYKSSLQSTNVKIFSKMECAQIYSKYSNVQIIVQHPTIVCAGILAGGIDACQGDSGGPLACINRKTRVKTLCGIVSTGIGCGQANSPGIYTNVSAYQAWIEQIAGAADKPKAQRG